MSIKNCENCHYWKREDDLDGQCSEPYRQEKRVEYDKQPWESKPPFPRPCERTHQSTWCSGFERKGAYIPQPCAKCREVWLHAATCEHAVPSLGDQTPILSRQRDYSALPPLPSILEILTSPSNPVEKETP